jgi:hypothetical protein
MSQSATLSGRNRGFVHVATNHDAIPVELKNQRRWIGWEWDFNPDLLVRFRVANESCSLLDPLSWLTFDEATARVDGIKVDGIGFVVGIDDDGNALEAHLVELLSPRLLPHEFDAEAAVKAPWYDYGSENDPDGLVRLRNIACHAVRCGLSDDEIVGILRQYACTHNFSSTYTDDRLLAIVSESDLSWERPPANLRRTKDFGTAYREQSLSSNSPGSTAS